MTILVIVNATKLKFIINNKSIESESCYSC